jgi:hypothetical protein
MPLLGQTLFLAAALLAATAAAWNEGDTVPVTAAFKRGTTMQRHARMLSEQFLPQFGVDQEIAIPAFHTAAAAAHNATAYAQAASPAPLRVRLGFNAFGSHTPWISVIRAAGVERPYLGRLTVTFFYTPGVFAKVNRIFTTKRFVSHTDTLEVEYVWVRDSATVSVDRALVLMHGVAVVAFCVVAMRVTAAARGDLARLMVVRERSE